MTECNTMEPTVFCPLCGIDSVLGDAYGLPVEDPTFLKDMHARWFETAYTRRSTTNPTQF